MKNILNRRMKMNRNNNKLSNSNKKCINFNKITQLNNNKMRLIN